MDGESQQAPGIVKRLATNRWFWLAAAVVVILLGIGWNMIQPEAPRPETPDRPAAVVPSSESEGAEAVLTQRPIEGERVVGLAFTEAVIGQIRGELERFGGWRPNDVLLSLVTDNTANYQLGVLDMVRRVMLAFNDKLARFGSTYPMNPHLQKAFNDLNFSATKFWFPSTESMYRDAIAELEAFARGLNAPQTKGGIQSAFYPRSDNLIFLIGQMREVLGSCQNDLTKTRENDGSPISYWDVDDYFYYSYGAITAALRIMEAVAIDFSEEIKSKSAEPLVQDIIDTLSQPVNMLLESEPLLIIDRPITSIFNNHRAQLNRPLADARQKMASLQATLVK